MEKLINTETIQVHIDTPNSDQRIPNQQQRQVSKRKHRRGKPKPKNASKACKTTNWKFQIPRLNYSKAHVDHSLAGASFGGGDGVGCNLNTRDSRRSKLVRSRSLLVPYNTNKFLMEEHLAEIPSSLLTGRTRDSSFSVDSDDNYFFSLPEDEEEFLTKEFANVYEKARVERLECLTKQQLIEECLQIEDRYSKDQGTHRQQNMHVQRISIEYSAKIRSLEEKIKELSRENYNLRSQLLRSATLTAAAAASPPSAAPPTGSAHEPTPMESSSEDSESDSSSTSATSSSSSDEHVGDNEMSNDERVVNEELEICRRSCSSQSSYSESNSEFGKKFSIVSENETVGVVIDNRCQPADSKMNDNSNQSYDSHNQNDDVSSNTQRTSQICATSSVKKNATSED